MPQALEELLHRRVHTSYIVMYEELQLRCVYVSYDRVGSLFAFAYMLALQDRIIHSKNDHPVITLWIFVYFIDC